MFGIVLKVKKKNVLSEVLSKVDVIILDGVQLSEKTTTVIELVTNFVSYFFVFIRYGYVEVSQEEKTHQPTLREQVFTNTLHVQTLKINRNPYSSLSLPVTG